MVDRLCKRYKKQMPYPRNRLIPLQNRRVLFAEELHAITTENLISKIFMPNALK